LNVIDPAYDLAETILTFALSSEEEDRLVRRYVEESGDVDVGQRLFINKLIAGMWTIKGAHEGLFETMQTGRAQQELHRRYLGAWDFLTRQAARYCGSRCRPSVAPRWRDPLVVLDVDGVIDRRVFGFPCTTTAGMKALSLLSTHGYSIALNTARSVTEVMEYCEAYGLAGGVAEHGAYMWDAVAQAGQPLVDEDTMRQLDELREHLRRIPGVFLDDRHQYSIRAYMFEKKPASLLLGLMNSMRSFCIGQAFPTPLPTVVVNDLLTTLRLDRLSFHHTTIDTAIVAKRVDKGTGLDALRNRVLGPNAETIAVGDTEADLPMFRAATRSYAPAHISCRRQARLLGCVISRYRFQRGLLDVARMLVKPSPIEPIERANQSDSEALFLDVLRAADRLNVWTLTSALFNRDTFKMFVR
jgi:hydroxymethylpyrimidine pyrophosphatase-like HAD family hydrolase